MCRQNPRNVQSPVPVTPPKEAQTRSPNAPSLRHSTLSIQPSPTQKSNLIFSLSEITAATKGFQSQKLGNSSAWKCTLGGKPAVVSQHPLSSQPGNDAEFRALLANLCNVRHARLVQLIGACASGSSVYAVHSFQNGADLARCLRGSKLIGFTVLSKWIQPIQVGSDIAKALEYVHHDIPIRYVHKHVKPSSVIVTEPDYRAKLAHFGSHMLTGESHVIGGELRRVGSGRISGVHGYMAPEYIKNGAITPKIDVYAFGVLLLEIVTGKEAIRYVYEEGECVYRKISLVEALDGLDGVLRKWIDGRLNDSFPLDCVERTVEITRACVNLDPKKRPHMRWVSNELSRVWIRSQKWEEEMGRNEGITVSLVAR